MPFSPRQPAAVTDPDGIIGPKRDGVQGFRQSAAGNVEVRWNLVDWKGRYRQFMQAPRSLSVPACCQIVPNEELVCRVRKRR